MEKLKAMIRKMVQEEGFSRGSRKDKEAAKSRSTVLGMIQVEEEEAPSFDMSKTSDRGDGNYVSGNLKESTIKNIIRQAIIDEAKNWPLMEGDVYAIVDKFNEKKQDYDQVYYKDSNFTHCFIINFRYHFNYIIIYNNLDYNHFRIPHNHIINFR